MHEDLIAQQQQQQHQRQRQQEQGQQTDDAGQRHSKAAMDGQEEAPLFAVGDLVRACVCINIRST